MFHQQTSRLQRRWTAFWSAYARNIVLRIVFALVVVSAVAVALVVGRAYVEARFASPTASPQQTSGQARPQAAIGTIAYVVNRDVTVGVASVEQAQILAVDTASFQVVGRIDARYDPQVALAPDGTYLYIAETDMSGDALREQLRVVDTATLQTVNTVEVPSRFRSTMFVYPGVLAASQQGRYVYVQTGTAFDGGTSAIATYDVAAGSMLPTETLLPAFCSAATLVPLHTEGAVAAVCKGPAHSVTIADVTSGQATTIEVPEKPGFINGIPKAGVLTEIAGSVPAPDGDSIFIVNKAGTVYLFDTQSRQFVKSIPLDLSGDNAVVLDQVHISHDGQRLYLGIGDMEALAQGVSQRVQVYDTTTWKLLHTVQAAEPIRSFALTQTDRIIMLSNSAQAVFKAAPDGAPQASELALPTGQLDAILTVP